MWAYVDVRRDPLHGRPRARAPCGRRASSSRRSTSASWPSPPRFPTSRSSATGSAGVREREHHPDRVPKDRPVPLIGTTCTSPTSGRAGPTRSRSSRAAEDPLPFAAPAARAAEAAGPRPRPLEGPHGSRSRAERPAGPARQREDNLPALFFCFSRRECEARSARERPPPAAAAARAAKARDRGSDEICDQFEVQPGRHPGGAPFALAHRRDRLPPRRPAAAAQGVGRASVHVRPAQAPVHDRDLRPRHQHAGAQRGVLGPCASSTASPSTGSRPASTSRWPAAPAARASTSVGLVYSPSSTTTRIKMEDVQKHDLRLCRADPQPFQPVVLDDPQPAPPPR